MNISSISTDVQGSSKISVVFRHQVTICDTAGRSQCLLIATPSKDAAVVFREVYAQCAAQSSLEFWRIAAIEDLDPGF